MRRLFKSWKSFYPQYRKPLVWSEFETKNKIVFWIIPFCVWFITTRKQPFDLNQVKSTHFQFLKSDKKSPKLKKVILLSENNEGTRVKLFLISSKVYFILLFHFDWLISEFTNPIRDKWLFQLSLFNHPIQFRSFSFS